MDFGFGPDEGPGALIVGLDEGIDVLPELGDGGEGRAAQGFPGEDGEPDFDLVEPGGSRRGEVEMHIGMRREPSFVLLVGVEVVKHAP